MNRRALLVSAGTLATAGVAGCLDRLDPSSGTVAGGDGYPTEEFGGEEVRLAPLEDVYEWYENEEIRFVDTRGQASYEEARIPGAVHSPGREDTEDPTADWDRETRVVTYCSCPHSLAVQRGSQLQKNGFENVYAIDEGFNAWRDAGYPVDGSNPDAEAESYRIEGRADASHADEYVWIVDGDGVAVESSRIDADGRYEATIQSTTLSADSNLTVETPTYTVEAELAALTNGTVTADTGTPAE